jgi:hypothetical protein
MSEAPAPCVLLRQDDNGNRYQVSRHATREEAQAAADMYEARGHKQLYWVECPD